MKNSKIYLGGDILKGGASLLREKEYNTLEKLGFTNIYSPIKQKDINDKKAVDAISNKTLCDRIVRKDTKNILESDIIIMDVDNDSVGSAVEMGQIYQFNWFHDKLTEILDNSESSADVVDELLHLLSKYPRKKVYCHTSDIRHTNIPEVSVERSFSINQYLRGVCRGASGSDIKTFDEIIEELKCID